MQPDFIDQCANYWSGSSWNKGYGNITTRYAKFLTIKMYFHEKFPGLPGDLSYDDLNRVQPLKAMPRARLVELSRFLDKVQSAQIEASDVDIVVTRSGSGDDLKASIFLPVVVESCNIYTLQTRILRQIAEEVPPEREDEFMKFAATFFANFHKLKEMYEVVSGMKYVVSIIAVPTMPAFPPEFFSHAPKPKPKPAPAPAPVPAPAPAPVPQPQPQQQQHQWTTFESSFPAVNTQGNWATFESTFPPVTSPRQSTQQKNPFVTQQPQPQQPQKGTFSDLAALLNTVKQSPKQQAPQTPPQTNLASPRYVAPKVNPHILEIEKLKKRIEELEKIIRELREDNSSLRIQLKKLSEELASARAALRREEENSANLQRALNDKNPLESAVKEMQKMVAQEKAASEELQRRYAALSGKLKKNKL